MGFAMVTVLLLVFPFLCGIGTARSPTFVVKGKVYCDACNAGRITKMSYFIEGASVAVRCASENGVETAYMESTTNKKGRFSVSLSHLRRRDACVVALLKSSSSACNILTSKAAASVVFNGQADGVILTGPFSFKPKRVSGTCLADVVVEADEAQPEGYYLSPPASSSSPVGKSPSPSPGYSSPSPVQKPPSFSPPSSSSSPVFKPPSTSPVDKPPLSPVYTPPSPADAPPSSGSPVFKPPPSSSPVYKPPTSSPVYKPPSSYTPPSSPGLPDDKPPFSKPPASSSPIEKPPASSSDKYPPSPPY